MKKYISIFLVLLGITTACQAKKKPNILFVLVDDQAPYDFDFYNSKSTLYSPTISKLASEGMVMDEVRHMGAMLAAVCTASRHMIMTGRTLWHISTFKRYTNPNNPQAATASRKLPAYTSLGRSYESKR